MAVRLNSPKVGDLAGIKGLRLGVARAHIKKPNRRDLLLMVLSPRAQLAAVFTQNKFCAAPVIIARQHLQSGSSIRALLVNTGNANAGTGEAGLAHASEVCRATGELLSCAPQQILPFSTGVIMEPLPVGKIIQALPACVADLKEDNWLNAALAIMTTDTVPKAVSKKIEISGRPVTITGIAKGSGMIRPNMATMLGFIATDATVAPSILDEILTHTVELSFNAITVDGDTSTNDACLLIATGEAETAEINDIQSPAAENLRTAVTEVAVSLAQAIVRDGEGASKFITIVIEQGRDREECRKIAYAIAHSPLVKTAFFASDPNLGRILAAIGNADVAELEVKKIQVYLDRVLVAQGGGRAEGYQEQAAQAVMRQDEITLRVCLGRGAATATFWTCDLSYDYVKINAEYRS